MTGALFALAYALTRHTSHFVQLLSYALLVVCPLMHLFHRRGHGKS
jgi:hypothetical protein